MRSFALIAVLAACSRPTELVVIVDSDLAVPGELDQVRVTVTGPAGMSESAEQALDGTGPELPLTLGVVPAGEALGPIDVVADGMLSGSIVVTRSARTTLIAGESLALYLFLARACRGVMCPDGETCTENGCATVEIDPADLPRWTGVIEGRDAGVDAGRFDGGPGFDAGTDGGPPPRVCTSGADCDDQIDCTRDVCTDDACMNLPDDSICTAGPDGVCDAENGCQYSTCTASTCTAGACQTAMCNGSMCDRTSLCSASEICCGGTCVASCSDGNPCTDDSCDGTACVHVPNTLPCSDGVFCNGFEVCGGGTCSAPGNPCSGSAVCDESNDVCTGCVQNTDCPPPVDGTPGACGGFADTCDEAGTRTFTRTTYTCQAGTCVASTSDVSVDCTRDTDGTTCNASWCGNYGPCEGFADACDSGGSETRPCTDYACRTGTCEANVRSESRDCRRTTDGVECMPTSCGPCGPCEGFSDVCDETGTCVATCSDYRCMSDACMRMDRPDTSNCTRPTEGAICEDGLFCTELDTCQSGTCRAGNDVCGGPCICDPSNQCIDPINPGSICSIK